jgi:hypothetical protein
MLDTFAASVKVEWDETSPLTPLGQIAFFVEFLKVSGRFDAAIGGVLPELMGMRKIVSEDSLRRALKAMPEAEGLEWHQRHTISVRMRYLRKTTSSIST